MNEPQPDASAPVVLIHGAWMRGWELQPLAARLRQAGFKARRFSYRSLKHDLAENAKRFASHLHELAATSGPVSVVAHSLGAVVTHGALELLGSASQVRRIVALGPPFRGSRVAEVCLGRPLLAPFVGRTARDWVARGGITAWPHSPELGIISGTRPLGAGRLIRAHRGPNDGMVAVAETRVDGSSGHIAIATNHVGLTFSSSVARLVARFLRHGTFDRPASEKPIPR